MSAAQPRNFLSIAIEQHLATMFNAIMNGSLQSKEEALVRLEKYSAQAEKINDTLLRGRVFSVRGTLHLTNGDLSQAEGCYRQAHGFYMTAGNIDRAFGMEGNLGLLQHQRGLYTEAVQLFLHSIGLLAVDDPNRSQKMSFTRINLAQAYLALFDFNAALVAIQESMMDYADILGYVRDHANDGIYIVEQRVYLGMATLGVGDIETTLSIASLSRDIAKQINTAYAQMLAGALTLRIVQKDLNAQEAIPALLEDLDRWIVQGNHDVITFVVLREEARYFQHIGAPVLARWYAERALTMSQRFTGDELRPAIEAILAADGVSD